VSQPGSNPHLSEQERERLILDHVPLLQHIAGRLSLELPAKVEREDLLGWGMLGLLAAADAWEPERGLKFSTYAYNRIRGAILDELRRQDFLPRGRREAVRDLDRALSALKQELGARPTPEQLAERLGWSLEQVDEALVAARSAALISLEDGPSDSLAQMLSDPSSEDPSGSLEFEEAKALLMRAIQELPDPEQTVITLYYGEGLLLREIGQVLDVTESRVSQLHGRALYRLNRELSLSMGRL
jgi:RNA polymerase sigma factor for flagellar operon FliA